MSLVPANFQACAETAFVSPIQPLIHPPTTRSSISWSANNPSFPECRRRTTPAILQVSQQTTRSPKSGSRRYAKKDDKESEDRGKAINKASQDGSPLGVAVVVLGSLAVNFLGDGDDPSNDKAWLVFFAASTAAGLSRLVQYYREKGEES